MSVLLIGAGGVGSVTAHKCAQHNDILGDICFASRTVEKCDRIIESIHRKNNLKDTHKKLVSRQVDANNVPQLVSLIEEIKPRLVINTGPPWVNVSIMEACVQTSSNYLDTSVATDLCSEGQQVPQAYDPQWAFRERFKDAQITGILGAGFDPGVVSIFCSYAQKHLFDEIDSIDVMDVNAGSHGKTFATNFDPETNMLEIQGDSFYWEEGEWKKVPCHTRSKEFEFPVVGNHKVYSMAHDEVRSLAEFIPARRIEFWMGFSDEYLNYFNVMKNIGLLSPDPVTTVDGITVHPLKVLKAVLPDPSSLAPNYTGKTCIGSLIKGYKDGQKKGVFLYNICDHAESYQEVESQAISFTTGVPAVTAALLFFKDEWTGPGLFNVEQLDPGPFLELMPKIGLSWSCVSADS